MRTIRLLLSVLVVTGNLGLSTAPVSAEGLPAEPMRVTADLRSETVLLPPSVPDKIHLTLVAFVTIESEAGIIAAIAVYDDLRTKRPLDYWELYDGSGDLLMINWFDRFGILRTAVDRGLLEQNASKLDGVLVLVQAGTLL